MRTSNGQRRRKDSVRPSRMATLTQPLLPPLVHSSSLWHAMPSLVIACVHRETPGRTRRVPLSSAVTLSGCIQTIRQRRAKHAYDRRYAWRPIKIRSSVYTYRPSTWRHPADEFLLFSSREIRFSSLLIDDKLIQCNSPRCIYRINNSTSNGSRRRTLFRHRIAVFLVSSEQLTYLNYLMQVTKTNGRWHKSN